MFDAREVATDILIWDTSHCERDIWVWGNFPAHSGILNDACPLEVGEQGPQVTKGFDPTDDLSVGGAQWCHSYFYRES